MGAVLIALIIGITINNACAEKMDKPQPDDGGTGTSMTAGLFSVIDGLLIGPDGKVYNKLESSKGLLFSIEQNSHHVSYDDQGRISISYSEYVPNPGEDTWSVSEKYFYSGLTVTIQWNYSYTDNDQAPGHTRYYNGTSTLTYLPLKNE